MNRACGAAQEILRLSELASRRLWINDVHPLAKLAASVCYIAVVMSYRREDVAGLLTAACYPVSLFILAELSFVDCISRLRLVLPLVCFIGLFEPIMRGAAGVPAMMTLAQKGVLAVLASYALIATTPIEDICYALRLVHLPAIIVSEILLIYRYTTLLLDEAGRVTDAYSLRAPEQRGVHWRAWGSLAGMMLLRAVDRAGRVWQAMEMRGFDGELVPSRRTSLPRAQSAAFFIFWAAAFALMRSLAL